MPPKIVVAPENTTAVMGNTVIFSCAATGGPALYIQWFKDGSELANDSRVTIYTPYNTQDNVFSISMLEICSLELEDYGEYSCRVSVGASSDTSYFTLEVVEGAYFPCWCALCILGMS